MYFPGKTEQKHSDLQAYHSQSVCLAFDNLIRYLQWYSRFQKEVAENWLDPQMENASTHTMGIGHFFFFQAAAHVYPKSIGASFYRRGKWVESVQLAKAYLQVLGAPARLPI